MEELLDIVNEHDQVIDQRFRSEIYAQQMTSFRVINGFLINKQGELWIPRRSADKKLFPLCLDASVGGHVMAGETYQEAFERELQEELNLDAKQMRYQMIAKLTPHRDNVSAFMHLYLIYTDTMPNYNQADFCESFWIDSVALKKKIMNGEPTKGDLPILIQALYAYTRNMGSL